MAAENVLLDALNDLRPIKGVPKSTCTFLKDADPKVIASISAAFDRGNTQTSISNTMRKAGAKVTVNGIRDHRKGACECGIRL
jgi:hypothetical protein